MRITKTVPAHTVSFEAISCKLDWLTMTPQFRAIRAGFRYKMDSCFWCRTKFQDGDTMALAIANKGNKVLCQDCAKLLLASDERFVKTEQTPTYVDLGHGFKAIPHDDVTLNGHQFQKTAVDGYSGPWAVIAPNGVAVDSESGNRPHKFATINDCLQSVAGFILHGCSTCGPTWEPN